MGSDDQSTVECQTTEATFQDDMKSTGAICLFLTSCIAATVASPRWNRFDPYNNGGSGGTFYPGGNPYNGGGSSGNTFYPGRGGAGNCYGGRCYPDNYNGRGGGSSGGTFYPGGNTNGGSGGSFYPSGRWGLFRRFL